MTLIEPEHNVAHDGPDGTIYGYFDELGHWEFWSANNNLLGVYSTWAEAVADFTELSSDVSE